MLENVFLETFYLFRAVKHQCFHRGIQGWNRQLLAEQEYLQHLSFSSGIASAISLRFPCCTKTHFYQWVLQVGHHGLLAETLFRGLEVNSSKDYTKNNITVLGVLSP